MFEGWWLCASSTQNVFLSLNPYCVPQPHAHVDVSCRSLQVWGMHCVAEFIHTFQDGAAKLAAMQLSAQKKAPALSQKGLDRLGGLRRQIKAVPAPGASW